MGLGLSEVPVEAVVDAVEEVVGGVDGAGGGDGPGGHAADEGVPRPELLPVFAVERGPSVAAAVERHLNPHRHVLRQYQRPERQRVRTYRREQNSRHLFIRSCTQHTLYSHLSTYVITATNTINGSLCFIYTRSYWASLF